MKLLVVHDAAGRILGMGEVHPNPRQRRVGVALRPGQFVIEVEREAAFPHAALPRRHRGKTADPPDSLVSTFVKGRYIGCTLQLSETAIIRRPLGDPTRRERRQELSARSHRYDARPPGARRPDRPGSDPSDQARHAVAPDRAAFATD